MTAYPERHATRLQLERNARPRWFWRPVLRLADRIDRRLSAADA